MLNVQSILDLKYRLNDSTVAIETYQRFPAILVKGKYLQNPVPLEFFSRKLIVFSVAIPQKEDYDRIASIRDRVVALYVLDMIRSHFNASRHLPDSSSLHREDFTCFLAERNIVFRRLTGFTAAQFSQFFPEKKDAKCLSDNMVGELYLVERTELEAILEGYRLSLLPEEKKEKPPKAKRFSLLEKIAYLQKLRFLK